ncbi:alpha/beta hydrolase domain protein [Cystobacter fuscus DSM 2262]|uniref:Alpha/beta hydrolase domain protein n=1 Tax=Cystobacter fuscus (strain ATCC 25194 / DSM 2262 / NBRC 100088 / M29) TaxID=1242864 RepID=S9QI02_CYSF2|nr:alpha/beta hydrolase [Cystobacter fuscus]EPX60924.1 alpha/beta hydrolase domain protein [Cystobacter fuscus DSM 2262]
MKSKLVAPPFATELAALLPALEGYVPVNMTPDRLEHFRALKMPTIEELIGDLPVQCVDYTIPGYQGVDIVVSVISRKDHHEPGPGIYNIHGGGMVMCNRFAAVHPLVDWAMKHDAVGVTVEYRLAPEHPHPIPVEDCYAGLEWMAKHAGELGFDPDRLVIFGGSGGGGLAAGSTLLARDRKGPKLAGQLLQCPMIDDRNETVSSYQYQGTGVWDRTSNLTAWTAVLGDRRGTDSVSPYAAPARATDLSGLPPTFIDVGAAEVFRDEAVAYASAIWAAGGNCELHVWGGAFHGFYDIAPQSKLAQACIAAREAWLTRLLAR